MSGRALLAAAVAAVLSAASAAAFASPDVVERIDETIEVRVWNLETVVVDKRGEPVSGLERDDFEVLVGGEPVPIVHFFAADGSRVVPGSPGSRGTASPMTLALYVDQANVDPQVRNRILDDLRAVLGERLGPRDRVLVTAADRLGFDAPGTASGALETIEAALERVASAAAQDRLGSGFGDAVRAIERLTSRGSEYTDAAVEARVAGVLAQIRAFADEAAQDTARTAGNLRRLLDAIAGLEGKKAIVYVGNGLVSQPGEALYDALRQALGRTAKRLAGGAASAPAPGGGVEDGRRKLAALVETAAARGVALYAVDAGGASSFFATGPARGSVDAGAGAIPGREEAWAPGIGFRRRVDLRGSLGLLASETGGLAADAAGGARRLFERLFDDARAHYSLGIRPAGADDGRVRRVEIRVGRRGLETRHPRIWRPLTADEEALARTRSALLGGGANPLGVRLESGEARPAEKGRYRVPISIHLPVTALAVEPRGADHGGRLSVFVAAGPDALAAEAMRKMVLPVAIPNAELLAALGRELDFRFELLLRGGAAKIAVGVRDDLAPELSIATLDLAVGDLEPAPR